MTRLLGAALGVLVLGAATPALAGGYWDAGYGYGDGAPPLPPPCRAYRPCPPPPCPPPRQDGWREDHWRGGRVWDGGGAWVDARDWRYDSGWRMREIREDRDDHDGWDEEGVVIPSEFFDGSGGGVGPEFLYDEGGGGGGVVESAGFAGAGAFAEASASAAVDVNVRFHERHHRFFPPHPTPCVPCQMHHMPMRGWGRPMAMHGWSGGGRRR